jgi:hypothetical protein
MNASAAPGRRSDSDFNRSELRRPHVKVPLHFLPAHPVCHMVCPLASDLYCTKQRGKVIDELSCSGLPYSLGSRMGNVERKHDT